LVLFHLILQSVFTYLTFVILKKGKSFSSSEEHLSDATSGLGKVKEGTKSSGVPLAIKYTYYRKKLSRKKFFSFQFVVEDDSGPGKQLPFWT
jgi:hypothetical protein